MKSLGNKSIKRDKGKINYISPFNIYDELKSGLIKNVAVKFKLLR